MHYTWGWAKNLGSPGILDQNLLALTASHYESNDENRRRDHTARFLYRGLFFGDHCNGRVMNVISIRTTLAGNWPRFDDTQAADGQARRLWFNATAGARIRICRALVSLAVVAVLGCAGETREVYYDTYALAAKDGAIQRGWLPLWLPVASTKIFVAQKLDSTVRMWAADVPVGTEIVLPSTCKPVRSQGLPTPLFERIWWPEGVPHARVPDQAYIYFKCGVEYLGLAPVGGKLVGWAVQ